MGYKSFVANIPLSAMLKKMRKPLPASDNNTITPKYLLGHENHFDPNVYTPEDMIKKGVLRGKGARQQRTA